MAGKHFMNPARAKHMGSTGNMGASESQADGAGDVDQESGQHTAPSIHIHSHDQGHTVHIMHANGKSEKSEHEHGDAEGIAAHIHSHIGGKIGQDHGGSAGDEMEDEHGFGPGV